MSNSIEKAIEIIKVFEGFRENKYICPAGHLTFGYGTLVKDYPDLKFPISEELATILLKKHVNLDYKFLLKSLKLKLNDNQEAALLDFIYNLGRASFQRSTLRMKINRGDFDSALKEFPRWNKARVNGVLVALKGLTRRRLFEKQVFISRQI